MCHPEKEQNHLISLTPFNRFSSNFHQNDRTVLVHLILVRDDIENVGQSQHLQKCLFLKRKYFKKTPNLKSC